MPHKLFKSGSGLAMIVPKELAEKYGLSPGSLIECEPRENGILVRPVETVNRLSDEWRNALDHVAEEYGPALEKLGE